MYGSSSSNLDGSIMGQLSNFMYNQQVMRDYMIKHVIASDLTFSYFEVIILECIM